MKRLFVFFYGSTLNLMEKLYLKKRHLQRISSEYWSIWRMAGVFNRADQTWGKQRFSLMSVAF